MASSDDMEKVSLTVNKASKQVVEEEVEVKKKIDRHCAFCLTPVLGEEVKICWRCKRRAYCSKECQKADWKLSKDGPAFNGKIHGYGQGHKAWCGLEVGEEDLDWKVAQISGKGLGLVALRDIPPLFRIIVEGKQARPGLGSDGRFSPYHPGMNDLVPLSTTDLSEKFLTNAIGTAACGFKVGLRISRTNHSCDSNASHTDDEDFNVLILFSTREIKKDEEICIAYIRFDTIGRNVEDQYYGKSPEFCRDLLLTKWGISCPPSCPCRDFGKFVMLKNCEHYYQESRKEADGKIAFQNMRNCMSIARMVGCEPLALSRLMFYAASIVSGAGITEEKDAVTYKMGYEYYKAGTEIRKVIYHPNNKSD